MSQGKQRRSDSSPSLFPFLAVLLCTVGALVLMLVMLVSQSQATVREAIDTRAERADELRVKVEKVRDSFREEREEIQLEIERKRMTLQSLEQQTSTLSKDLDQLNKTSELIDKELSADDSVEKVESAVTELQKQLKEAAERLKDKVEKPSGEKPVFAIIPYEGTSGTHRRPIYLECRADGILIQPEGVMIGLKDLRPPYGPGNPLDAALRKVRTHYAPDGAALNSAAYPLLVVRSSGIRTYALARMAMAGWDDQFGYELIEDDMELTFPEGETKLAKELESTLSTARDRQAALVMAMPGKYRKAMDELSDDNITFADDETELSDGAGFGTATSPAQTRTGNVAGGGGGSGGAFGPGDSGMNGGAGDLGANSNIGGAGNSPGNYGGGIAGSRGGFAYSPDGSGSPGSRGQAGGPRGNSASRPGAASPRGFATGGDAASFGAGDGTMDSNGMHGGDPNSSNPNGGAGSGSNSFGASPNSMAGGNASKTGTGSFAEGAFNGNQFTRAGAGGSAASGGMDSGDPQSSNGESGGEQSSRETSASGNKSGRSGAGKGNGNFRDAMNAARDKQSGNAGNASGTNKSQTASATDTGTGGTTMVSANSDGFGSMGGNSADAGSSSDSGTPTANLSMKKSDKKNAEAVAKRRGRGWAWTAGPPRQTAVVRHIRIACYEDRWVILPDAGSKDKSQTVMLDVSLQTSAEQLAKVVSNRMDRWGLALDEGYWKPVLQVDVAPRGETRYDQLVRLLDGSGLDIERVSPNTPGKK